MLTLGSGSGANMWMVKQTGTGYPIRLTLEFQDASGTVTTAYDGTHDSAGVETSVTITNGQTVIEFSEDGGVLEIPNVPAEIANIVVVKEELYDAGEWSDEDPWEYYEITSEPMSDFDRFTVTNPVKDPNGNNLPAFLVFSLTDVNGSPITGIYSGISFRNGITSGVDEYGGTTSQSFSISGGWYEGISFDAGETKAFYIPHDSTLIPIKAAYYRGTDVHGSVLEFTEIYHLIGTKTLKDANGSEITSSTDSSTIDGLSNLSVSAGQFSFDFKLKSITYDNNSTGIGQATVQGMNIGDTVTVSTSAGGGIDFGWLKFDDDISEEALNALPGYKRSVTYTFEVKESGIKKLSDYSTGDSDTYVVVNDTINVEFKTTTSLISDHGVIGFSSISIDSVTYKDTAGNDTGGLNFTNIQLSEPPPGGDLRVYKITEDDPDPSGTVFTFRAKFEGEPVDSSVEGFTNSFDPTSYTSASLTNVADDTWQFTIRGAADPGNYIEFKNLPVNITYRVWEVDENGDEVSEGDSPADGWELTEVGRENEGAIYEDGSYNATFVNTCTSTPTTHTLTVNKVVAGSGDTNKEFNFTVSINGLSQGTVITVDSATTDNTLQTTYTADATGIISIRPKLKHNGKLVLTGIPEGKVIDVSEDDYSAEGYTTECDPSGTGNAYETGNTPSEPIMSNYDITINFRNTLSSLPTHTLTVSKTVDGSMGDKSKEFGFTIDISNASSATMTVSSITNGSGASEGEALLAEPTGVYEVNPKLAHNGSIVISGIPAGAEVNVYENDYSGEGYVTQVKATGDADYASGRTKTINSISADTTIDFKNTLDADVPTGLVTRDWSMGIFLVILALAVLYIRARANKALGTPSPRHTRKGV